MKQLALTAQNHASTFNGELPGVVQTTPEMSIPILMVTSVNIRRPGYKFSPDTDGEYLPVDDFIDKPAKPENLVKKVAKLLEQKVSRWANWPNPEA